MCQCYHYLQQFRYKKVNPGSKTTVTLFLFSFLLKYSQLCQIILFWMCNCKLTLMEYDAILVSTHHLRLLMIPLVSSNFPQCKFFLATSWIISECFDISTWRLLFPIATQQHYDNPAQCGCRYSSKQTLPLHHYFKNILFLLCYNYKIAHLN